MGHHRCVPALRQPVLAAQASAHACPALIHSVYTAGLVCRSMPCAAACCPPRFTQVVADFRLAAKTYAATHRGQPAAGAVVFARMEFSKVKELFGR